MHISNGPYTLANWATTTIALSSGINLRPCLVPTYMSELPADPTNGVVWDGSTYNAVYKISKDSNGRIHLVAENDEPNIPRVGDPIEVTR